jgi:O-antigen ligase
VLLAYVIVKRDFTVAMVLLLLPCIAYVLTRRLGGILAGLTLLLLLPSWYTLGVAQAGVIRVACLCALVILLLNHSPRPTWIDVALVLFVAIIVLGWWLQDDQPHAGRIMLNEIQPVAFFFAARVIPSRDLSKVLIFVFFVGTLGAITVLYELRAGHVLFADPTRYYWNGGESLLFRPGGIFGSPPAASTILTLTALCGLPTLRRLRGWGRVVASLCMMVTLVAVVSTFTRTALIAFAVSLLVYLWLSRSPMLNHQRVVLGLVVLLLGSVLLLPKLESGKTFQQGVLRGGTFAARVGYWGLALPIATSNSHNFFIGIGSEALEVPVVGGSAPSEVAASPVLIELGTHSQYVLTLLEQGVIGLIALLAWLTTTFVAAAQYARTSRDPNAAACAVGMLAVAIIMLTDNLMLNGPSLALAMLISGLIVGLKRRQQSTATEIAAP